MEKIQAIYKVQPPNAGVFVKVMSRRDDYWPLPWYLRQFKPGVQSGWFGDLPPDPLAPVMIVSANLQAELEEKSGASYMMTGLFSLRSGTFLELYVEAGLWKKYVASRQKKN